MVFIAMTGLEITGRSHYFTRGCMPIPILINSASMNVKNHCRSVFPALVALVLLAGCGQSNTDKTPAATGALAPDAGGLTLDTFGDFPPEIDGCSCYFSSDSAAFGKGQFLYVNDYMETSFLKINGMLTKFVQTSLEEIDGATSVMTAKAGDQYELTIEIEAGSQNGDETWLKTGRLKVTDKSGHTVSTAFYGECGC